jgi:hypothetical protein
MQITQHISIRKDLQASQEVCTLVWWNTGKMEGKSSQFWIKKFRQEALPCHAISTSTLSRTKSERWSSTI